ncbi:ribose-phosphate pyrophosphokinase [Aquirufa regiilacus]|jgi:ribose-phosphate pyrophosphokinase|uniref:Ribose-phosphate pyrophosphokinase n=1 Tax=Aquirufa regiilacus TaxID=3024868 RepID=A0ABU3TR10_9BACT|nr:MULTISPECIES: ribose-phosphate pyrophosphokinase [unclassified Aquirufa]MBP6054049.1 ribose-phosphate pyrophosphokinase [Cytophagaceae bacterium]MBP6092932.1 ribose-phosphate pyrophosphokinase [Cytophagaceae bacterium]MDT8887217.1 ribose-phosphate pyrophosphokinase [Aquirufa sp. LEPPI-3A]MDU0808107.1 ribose-phosphate pyrophosphokinase [Aquirufa sp. LEOWEIH-7C]
MAAINAVKIFSGSASNYLAKEIAKYYGKDLGAVTTLRFSDGEMSPSFDESVRGCDVFIIQSTFPTADNLMELLLMIDAARRASAHYVTAVIPYFGYSRQDRKDRPRVGIGAKLIGNLLTAAGADRLMTIDLHAGQIQGFMDFPVDHLEGNAIFVPYLKSLNLQNIVFASPDVGGVVRTRNMAKFFNAEMVICDKHRKRANEIASMQLIGDVKGADVVLVDDLIDTGGTLCKAAQLLMDKGANSVRAVVTHPVLSGKAYENISNSVLTELLVTDTIPQKQTCDKIKVLSVAELFAKAIGRIRDHESISSLFIKY